MKQQEWLVADEWIIEGWGGKYAEDTSHIRDLSGISGEDNST